TLPHTRASLAQSAAGGLRFARQSQVTRRIREPISRRKCAEIWIGHTAPSIDSRTETTLNWGQPAALTASSPWLGLPTWGRISAAISCPKCAKLRIGHKGWVIRHLPWLLPSCSKISTLQLGAYGGDFPTSICATPSREVSTHPSLAGLLPAPYAITSRCQE